MEFSKISEQNAWDEVAETTGKVRRGDVPEPALLEWFRSQGIDLDRSVFPALVPFDDGVYSGTLVNQERKVLEYFVDLDAPGDGEIEDVTESLGPKDPSHPASDVKDLITMSLVYYDEAQTAAA
jgi:hypothetical protein